MKERRELSIKLPLCPLTFGSYFYPPTSTLLFQTLSFSIFFFSSRRKEKKNHREEKNAKKRGSFPLSSHYALSLLVPTCTLSLLPFYYKRFLIAYFYY
jgi:hypothetical protein